MRCTLTSLSLAAALVLAGPAAATVRVVTTTPMLGAIAEEIGSGRVSVESIARPDEDPHFVAPRPSFVVKLRRADLFVQNGMELEIGWVPPLLRGARNAAIQPGGPGHVDASQGVAALEIPSVVSRAEGDVHPSGNPHYWLDPANLAVVARNIADGLVRVDPAGREAYEGRLRLFEEDLGRRLAAWREDWRAVEGMELVSYHRLWPYLEQASGVRFIDELEPKPGIPPSPRHLASLTELMRGSGATTIARAPYSPARPAEELARRVGGRVVVLPVEPGSSACHGVAWHSVFDTITERLLEAARSGRAAGS